MVAAGVSITSAPQNQPGVSSDHRRQFMLLWLLVNGRDGSALRVSKIVILLSEKTRLRRWPRLFNNVRIKSLIIVRLCEKKSQNIFPLSSY
jgi:hypothetical protein